MRYEQNKAASVSGDLLAAGRSVSNSDELHLHFTPSRPPCQDVFAEKLRLLAEIAKRCGNYIAYCWLRKQFLLRQAALYSGGDWRCTVTTRIEGSADYV